MRITKSPVLLRLLAGRLSSFPFLVDCGLGIQHVHCVFIGDGLLHKTVVKTGHVSLLGDVARMLLVVFNQSLRFC